VFLGDYQHTLDAKGRVSLPAKFRAGMTGNLVIVKGIGGCLYVYSADEYSSFIEELLAKKDFDPRMRRIRLFFTSGAVEAELNSAGRISLPQVLRDYAELEKDVAIIGNGNRIEIWDAQKWADHRSEDEGSIEDLTKELAAAGLL
jgi:MraZ protein